MEIKNHYENLQYFKRLVRGARLSRGKSIPNKNIIDLTIQEEPLISISATIQGSGTSKYIIHVSQNETDKNFTLVHDCPDFEKGNRYCKHVVKLLLVLEPKLCSQICNQHIYFTSNYSSVKESKVNNYLLRARRLLDSKNFTEAIDCFERAYNISKDTTLLNNILQIAFQNQLFTKYLQILNEHPKLIESQAEQIEDSIKIIFKSLMDHDFKKQFLILSNIKPFFKTLPDKEKKLLLNEFKKSGFSNKILKFYFLHEFAPIIKLPSFFANLNVKDDNELFQQISNMTLQEFNESILNMESLENVEIFERISRECNFPHLPNLQKKLSDYKVQLNGLFLKGLNQKHAFLRSLVISNQKKDSLRELKFKKKYNFPSILWTNPYRKEPPLHYYVLEKCGIERHHLEYISEEDFIQNYPVFKTIFNSNNPLPHKIKAFWGEEEPKIKNIVFESHNDELNFQLNVKNLDDLILVEWDLAKIPLLGSYICQFHEGFIIPDDTHPLTNQIKPFDLTLCFKKPVAIKGNGIKILRPSIRVNLPTALNLVWDGMEFITSQFPFQIIQDMKNFKIDEMDAIEQLQHFFQESILPKKEEVRKIIIEFVRTRIKKELNELYQKLITKKGNKNKILMMLGFEHYASIFKKKHVLNNFKKKSLIRNNLEELRLDFKNFIVKKLIEFVKKGDFHAINIKNLKRFYSFRKFTIKIINELKIDLENKKIIKLKNNKYDITQLNHNYYGNIIIEKSLNTKISTNKDGEGQKIVVTQEDLNNILENFSFLKLKPPPIISHEK